MRVIIAGSRDVNDYWLLEQTIRESGFEISSVVSGGAAGVDALGERYAKMHNVTVDVYPADWREFGKAAGPIRNQKMAENADALIAIRKDLSRGTTDMINRAKEKGLKVFVKEVQAYSTNR